MNIHTTFKKFILPSLFAGAVLISSGTAFGALSPLYTDSLGRAWTNPFSEDLLNKDYNTQAAAFSTDGYTFATYSQILESAVHDVYSNDIDGVTKWIAEKFFGGNDPSRTGLPCGADFGCDIRTNDPDPDDPTGSHVSLLGSDTGYFTSPYTNDTTLPWESEGGNGYYLGALGFQVKTPEPSMIGLLGTGLMLMGLAAYRRKQK